jgi:hypothetical protein
MLVADAKLLTSVRWQMRAKTFSFQVADFPRKLRNIAPRIEVRNLRLPSDN